jgi:hypothetical protein
MLSLNPLKKFTQKKLSLGSCATNIYSLPLRLYSILYGLPILVEGR